MIDDRELPSREDLEEQFGNALADAARAIERLKLAAFALDRRVAQDVGAGLLPTHVARVRHDTLMGLMGKFTVYHDALASDLRSFRREWMAQGRAWATRVEPRPTGLLDTLTRRAPDVASLPPPIDQEDEDAEA